MLVSVQPWPSGALLGFDLETTGVDRFADVPVSYALVSVVDGIVLRSWSGLIDPGRAIPAEATAVHGITTERARADGMPLPLAVGLLADAIVAAGRRGVPLVGMRLDYDLTMIETQALRLFGLAMTGRGWHGPVLDAAVLDRRLDPARGGRRTLVDLCAHYGVSMDRPHDATADAVASVEVIYALAARHEGLRATKVGALHEAQVGWYRAWAGEHDARRRAQGEAPMDPRDFLWPLAPAALRSAA